MAPYVLITPAHNEERTIEQTILSIVRQTIRPREWVIVNDASTDLTKEIVESYLPQQQFIKLLNISRSPGRHFANKVKAFNAGSALISCSYHFIGNLDADITLDISFYERLLKEFARNPELGLTGGMIHSKTGERFVSQNVALDSVAGAVQFFRRECYNAIGGYTPLPYGGIDSLAEIKARMHGWEVKTIPDIIAREHRQTGTAARGPIAARFYEGKRFHSLGYTGTFFLLRCLYRLFESPMIIGSLAALYGFGRARLAQAEVAVEPCVKKFLRMEQRKKMATLIPLIRLFRGAGSEGTTRARAVDKVVA